MQGSGQTGGQSGSQNQSSQSGQSSSQSGQGGQQTGARDETYDIVSVLYHALKGAELCQKFTQDARDDDLRSFFQHAHDAQRQLAEKAKQCFQQQVGKSSGQGGGSAFSFGQGQQNDTNGMNAQGRGYGDIHGGSTGIGQQQHEMAGGQSGGTSGSSSR